MGEFTGISWTDHTFNPWWGCVRVSPGCKNCYAADLAGRYGQGWTATSERRFMTAAWKDPPKWNRAAEKAGKPAFVFCASMADIMEDVPEHVREQTEAARLRLWALIDATPWLVWLILTKRPERVHEVVPAAWMSGAWPSNVWIGCTVEDQEHAEKRLPWLLCVPAPIRFVSYEPALGAVDFTNLDVIRHSPNGGRTSFDALGGLNPHPGVQGPRIDWLIIGGESGPKARAFNVEWAAETIRQCREAGVKPWMKQVGDRPIGGGVVSGHMAQHFTSGGGVYPIRAHHGADPAEWPEALQVQERPEPMPVRR